MAMVSRRRRFGLAGLPSGWRSGLGNVPIPGLDSHWSLGDPASDAYGASYYDGSKVIGVVAGGPGGQSYYETEGTLYATPFSQDIADKIAAAAAADFASPEHAAYAYDQAAASAPAPMHAVLTDPEWRALALQGATVNWNSLSAELQDKIKQVPALYASLTGGPMPDAPAPTQPTGPARYLQNGVETYADGSLVPGGYNALTDLYRQIGVAPGTYSPQVATLLHQYPNLFQTLTPAQQTAYTTAVTAATQPAATPTAGSSTTGMPDVPSVPMGGGGGGTSPSSATVAAVVAGTLAAANPNNAGLPLMPPSGPAFDLGGAQPVHASILSGGLLSNPWLLAGVAAVVVLSMRKRAR